MGLGLGWGDGAGAITFLVVTVQNKGSWVLNHSRWVGWWDGAGAITFLADVVTVQNKGSGVLNHSLVSSLRLVSEYSLWFRILVGFRIIFTGFRITLGFRIIVLVSESSFWFPNHGSLVSESRLVSESSFWFPNKTATVWGGLMLVEGAAGDRRLQQ